MNNIASEVMYDAKRSFMNVNVILSFQTSNPYEGNQEFFDLNIPVRKQEADAVSFFHKKLFKRIVKKCQHLGRRPEDLIKISTCSNWTLFEEVTGLPSLSGLGHSCKWYFGNGRLDLDPWEKALIEEFNFGIEQDISWVSGRGHSSFIS